MDEKRPLPASWLGLLDPEEHGLLQRLRSPQQQRDYVTAHVLRRRALSSCWPSIGPAQWQFTKGEAGKPQLTPSLAADTAGLEFNLSHTHTFAACVVAGQRAVGTDVERIRPMRQMGALMKTTLTETELRDPQLFAEQGHLHFFRLWGAKEAYLKGVGCGLRLDMRSVCVEIDGPRAKIRRRRHALWIDDHAWDIFFLYPRPDVVLTTAVANYGRPFAVKVHPNFLAERKEKGGERVR